MTELAGLLWQSTLETLYMVGISAVLCGFGGLALGILLTITEPTRGLVPIPWAYRFLSITTNFGRSVPFIILMVAVTPFTRFVVHTSIGTEAAIVPLVIGATPYAGRLVESALRELDPGVIDAVVTMGASPWQVVTKVYLPEAVPSLCRAMTIMTITLISFSAMAGALGGGGLGDLAIRYGYQRFRSDIMVTTVLTLVVIVQAVQWLGDTLAKRFDRQ